MLVIYTHVCLLNISGYYDSHLHITDEIEIGEKFFSIFPRNFAVVAYGKKIGFGHISKIITLNCSFTGFWAAKKMSVIKSFFLKEYLSNPLNFDVDKRETDHMKLYPLLNRVMNSLIYTTVALNVLERIGVGIGKVVQTLLAFGGVSSLAIGFALKEPLENILSGLILLSKNTVRVGDKVRMSDGEVGQVEEIGWTETVFRGKLIFVFKDKTSLYKV